MTEKAPLREVSLDDKYQLDQTKAYLTGIEALVRLPILQHQRDQERGYNTAGFVSGYRGSPLGGLDQALWEAESYLKKHNITFVPGVNEDLAATAVRGSQEVEYLPGAKYDGVFGLWYGKGPGLDRSIDAFRHANAAGTSKLGGVLAVVGDDHGCKSSTFPYQSEHIFMSLSMPVLAPANVQEVLDLGVYGWELSRYCGCWVGLKAITENMDSAISAEIDPRRVNIRLPQKFPMPEGGVNYRWPDSPLAQEERLNKYKIYAARAFAFENELNRIVINSPNPRLGIITSGKSYLDVMQAFDDLNIDDALAAEIGIRVYKVGMPWPLEPLKTHEFAEGLDEILVVEEKRSVIEDQLTGQLYNWPVEKRPRVVGEYNEFGEDLLTNLGELTPAMIARAIAARISRFYTSESIDKRVQFINRKEQALAKPRAVSVREPMYCSGCPHNTSTAVPEGSIAGGGIGCHYMSTWSKNRPAHGFTHMGGEGVTWTGQAPFTETPHIFQNMGDGTYFHSGLMAIRQSVSAKVNITYKILYNDAVAMTGGQSLDGSLTLPELILQLKGEGIKRIELVSDNPLPLRHLRDATVTVSHRDDLNGVQKLLRETPGCTALIYEQTCATEKRRRRKRGTLEDPNRRLFINEAVCEGCGDCSVVSNCLSVIPLETEFGRKRQIDQQACNKDYSCAKGFCPSFVSVVGGSLRKNAAAEDADDGFGPLPQPVLPEIAQPWNILVTGVGGTGVLTVTAVLAMAAHLENKGVATMNQTGLAQKFGPVVSHLRIARLQEHIHAVRIPAGDADVIIGCDLVVTATDDALAKMNIERSHAVVNDTMTPTAEFVHNPDAIFHDSAMKQTISEEVGADKVAFLPASGLATALLGDGLATNLFMLGFAYQRGLVPVSEEAIHRALELNGVRVDFNQKAFLWGRRYQDQPARVVAISGLESRRFKPATGLQDIVEARCRDLTAYQDAGYAERYRQQIAEVSSQVHALEAQGEAFVEMFAKVLHRVMAYKDEYEVARLYSDGRFQQRLNESFEGDIKLEFHMAPPMLSPLDPDSGLPRKIIVGPYMMKLFPWLARMKRLRGSRWDVFGYSAERKLERAMIDEVLTTASTLAAGIRSDNAAQATEVLGLALAVRGYGHIKQKSYEQYRQRLALALRRFNGDELNVVEVQDVV